VLESLANALRIPDLRNKLLFTLGMLVVFRFIAHVPVPGVDTFRLEQLFQQSQLLGMLDLFSGGAMQNFSIAAMGVYPYITATIIMQLLVPIIPQLEELSKEGEAGRQRITTITHWLMVPLAMLQAYATSVLLQSQGIIANIGLGPGQLLPTASIIISMTAGTALLVWLGELITENGIGNGISIIIFAGIVSQLPLMVGRTLFGGGEIGAGIVFAVLGLVIIAAIVFVQESQRRIPVHYAKRVRGTRVYGGQSTHIPLRVNSAGMIPIIFAMSLMLFPGTVANYFTVATGFVGEAATFIRDLFDTTGIIYWVMFFLLVVFFAFFYTWVTFQQQRLAENLQKNGGFIPGIRPGRPTQQYLNGVLFRITWLGAMFLGVIAILPFFTQGFGSSLVLSSTGLLIVVGVVVDTMKQLEAQLMMRNYEGFIR
jgi:preprotein translocase subunit SecY